MGTEMGRDTHRAGPYLGLPAPDKLQLGAWEPWGEGGREEGRTGRVRPGSLPRPEVRSGCLGRRRLGSVAPSYTGSRRPWRSWSNSHLKAGVADSGFWADVKGPGDHRVAPWGSEGGFESYSRAGHQGSWQVRCAPWAQLGRLWKVGAKGGCKLRCHLDGGQESRHQHQDLLPPGISWETGLGAGWPKLSTFDKAGDVVSLGETGQGAGLGVPAPLANTGVLPPPRPLTWQRVPSQPGAKGWSRHRH